MQNLEYKLKKELDYAGIVVKVGKKQIKFNLTCENEEELATLEKFVKNVIEKYNLKIIKNSKVKISDYSYAGYKFYKKVITAEDTAGASIVTNVENLEVVLDDYLMENNLKNFKGGK